MPFPVTEQTVLKQACAPFSDGDDIKSHPAFFPPAVEPTALHEQNITVGTARHRSPTAKPGTSRPLFPGKIDSGLLIMTCL